MPVVSHSSYVPPKLFANAHAQTIFPSLLRRVRGIQYVRERIDTPDGDFVDVDTSKVGAAQAAILLHGLEGDSSRAYMRGMARALNKRGWDALAFNFRGCSGESNRTLRFYHSGETGDLQTVISYVTRTGAYARLALVGFSLGGNVILKYLGERGRELSGQIWKAVVFSVPCDLASCSLKLGEPGNRIYMRRFLRMLRAKVRMKMELMPHLINDQGYERIKNFKEYDDRYTAPMFGFRDAYDYWEKASSKPLLRKIVVPTLIVNAADDPFLADPCYPEEEARDNPALFLEVPEKGGHVGFVAFNREGEYWSETRALQFLSE
ncbi:MAG: alpha/beta fold hydrolase [Deltaproteobacteria bacterium]|nr:alpha/beta fold hydrolase [Deltaproteobacteria bacterium]